MSEPNDFHKLITSVQDGPGITEFEKSKSPFLGLFYVRNVNVTISPFRGFGTVGVIDFGKKKITRYNKQA